MSNVNMADYPHKIGEYVIYRHSGICRIDDIITKTFDRVGEKVYYVLGSVYEHRSVVYVPADIDGPASTMRSLMDADEIDGIIRETESINHEWIPDCKLRAIRFEELLSGGKRADILWLVKTLSKHKKEVEAEKKRFCASDDKILSAAEKSITEEFAFVLNIGVKEVIPFILSRIDEFNA